MLSALRRVVRPQPPRPALPAEIEKLRTDAEKGDPEAQTQWGRALLESVYFTSDPDAAFRWFSIAARSDYGPAWNMLGRCAHFGHGCPKDLAQAAQYYAHAARCGDEWGRYNLGILTLRGLGLPASRRRAYELFRQAALNGHAKSMNLYARFLEEGWETPRDPAAALEWYRRSAEGGDYRGQHNYATALAEAGKLPEALSWWRKALPESTSDILLAMQQRLSALGDNGDPVLLAHVRKRLAEIQKSVSAAR